MRWFPGAGRQLRSPLTTTRYRIETSDGDWITFLSYMVAAVREVAADFGKNTEALLRHVAAMGPTREVVLGQFLADLGSLPPGSIDIILDDYHLIEGSADVREIIRRVLERAPDQLRVILAGRGRPNLALGRLLAGGQISELTIDDLRFTKPEIEELFSATYRQPIDQEACDVIADRTEGWAASLQLVSASIAVSQPSEVATFIAALDGAKGPIYDFLAEEVLTRLSPRTQRVMVHASLMDRVREELVSAALSVVAEPPGEADVTRALADAEALGLLSDRGAVSGGRIHPLFRQFLAHHLELATEPDQIIAMHRSIAVRAEPIDWLVSAKHYALGREPDEAMRVLGSAASEALGTGAWGAAVQILDLMPETTPPPSVEVVKARALVSQGDTDAALGLLATLDSKELTPEELGLIALTRAAAYHLDGEGSLVAREINELAVAGEVPAPLREVALAWREMLRANSGGRITDAVDVLRRLAVGQRRSGLRYFAGISLHNAANAELARGRYAEANRLAIDAEKELLETEDAFHIITSSRSISAVSLAERGEVAQALEIADLAAGDGLATADAIAEAAYLHAVTGGSMRARSLLEKFDRGVSRWSRELSSRAQACCARVALGLSEGNLQAAHEASTSLAEIEAPDVDSTSRLGVIRATLAVLARHGDAHEATQRAIDIARGQDAWRWMARARILESIGSRDGDGLAFWIAETEHDSCLALLELADVVAMSLSILQEVPEALERSIVRFPERWLGSLRRQVQVLPTGDAAHVAALLSRFGTLEDARLLRDYDSALQDRKRRTRLTSGLVRRVSPTVRVHDLGPTSYEVGSRRIDLSATRRKAAALLLFLVTRPELAAPREQAMECLWPDQSPKSAMNSLHQTLFFLRRDIEPWYEDGSTADYVRMESDMVSLDSDLFQVDSVAFNRQAADIAATNSARERGPELLRLYRGSFAPEFEYEEWAQEWRAQLHGTYLHLAHLTATAMLGSNSYAKAVDLLAPVILVDPLAYELRSTLIACLAKVGAADAAQSHYRSMASIYSRDMGVPAPSYDEVIRGIED